MRPKRFKSISRPILITFAAAFLSCAVNQTPVQIGNKISKTELDYYSDAFDKMREDIWDRAGYLYREEQVQNFRQADLLFEDGQLIIRTQPGSFSKGGLTTKYSVKGDFDVQLELSMAFKAGSWDMDQVFSFAVLDNTAKPGKMSFVSMGLALSGGAVRGSLFSNCVVNGIRKRNYSQKIDSFNGSLRITRAGEHITSLFQREGETGWNKLNACRLTDNDMLVGFQLRNFFVKRSDIIASDSISAAIRHFKINAAHEIIEEEI